jgi:hypothetical protein
MVPLGRPGSGIVVLSSLVIWLTRAMSLDTIRPQ